jgi:succinate dehydrogenase hydrophobic anchor subunit
MAVTADQHAQIQTNPAYRAAVWVCRVLILGMIGFLALLVRGDLGYDIRLFVFFGSLVVLQWVAGFLQLVALHRVVGLRDSLFDVTEARRLWRDAVLHWR